MTHDHERHADPDVVILSGTITVTTATGTLSGPDVTLWNPATGHIDKTINAGTGAWAGATGDRLPIGSFDMAAGTGSATPERLSRRRRLTLV